MGVDGRMELIGKKTWSVVTEAGSPVRIPKTLFGVLWEGGECGLEKWWVWFGKVVVWRGECCSGVGCTCVR